MCEWSPPSSASTARLSPTAATDTAYPYGQQAAPNTALTLPCSATCTLTNTSPCAQLRNRPASVPQTLHGDYARLASLSGHAAAPAIETTVALKRYPTNWPLRSPVKEDFSASNVSNTSPLHSPSTKQQGT